MSTYKREIFAMVDESINLEEMVKYYKVKSIAELIRMVLKQYYDDMKGRCPHCGK